MLRPTGMNLSQLWGGKSCGVPPPDQRERDFPLPPLPRASRKTRAGVHSLTVMVRGNSPLAGYM